MRYIPIAAMRIAICGLLGLLIAASAPSAGAQDRPWLDQKLLEAAKKEGSLIVYGSMNEEEALPFYKVFEEATGIKVTYVRASDTGIIGRIAVEHRAKQYSWDLVVTTPVNRLPDDVLAQIDPPQAKELLPFARGPNRRWYGAYANYNTPAYNTKFVSREQLPKSYEEFAHRKDWAGKVAIDKSDTEWVMAMYSLYGEAKGRKIIQDIVAALNPVLTDGHLALARSVAAGEYWVALNNYTSLTINVKLAGAPTDFWPLDPVALFFGSLGVAQNAPHPNAARLAANFILSREGQQFLTRRGRLPTRPDVETNPPGVTQIITARKVVPSVFSAAEQKRWATEFASLFRKR